MNNKKSVAFYTLGCKVNSYDTDAMIKSFKERDYLIKDFNEPADIYIVNTCTVTHLGDKKSRQMLRRAKRNNPNSLIVATGCYAQVSPEKINEIEEVDLIVGTANRSQIVDIVEKQNSKINIEDFEKDHIFDNTTIDSTEGHTRAYIKVEDGCRQYCSYCIVPYARGPIRSRSIEDTVKEISGLVKAGYKEVVLTGIHVASYNNEGKRLIDLIEEVSKIPGLERIRLSSLEPTIITEKFLERLSKIPEFCPHFHLSLQSGSSGVLKRMNRHYTPDIYSDNVDLIRKYFPNAGITTDIIVGFPGETDEEFKETVDFANKIKFSKIHIFPYSPREGTPAAKFNSQVDSNLKNIRVKELTEAELFNRDNFYKENDNTIEEVLVERNISDNIYSGYTKNYIPIIIESDTNLSNTIIKARLKYSGSDNMIAERI